jgi:hypothetical protein
MRNRGGGGAMGNRRRMRQMQQVGLRGWNARHAAFRPPILRVMRIVRAAALTLSLVASLPSTAWAQEVQIVGPLRGAPTLVRRPLFREGRFCFAAFTGTALAKGSPASVVGGAEALFHPVDPIGVGLWAAAGDAAVAAHGAPWLRAAVSPELVLVPIQGKLSRLDIRHYDVHLDGGAAWIDIANHATGGARGAPMVGLGFTTFFAEFMSFGVDYRRMFDGPWHSLTVSLGYWPGAAANDHDDDD